MPSTATSRLEGLETSVAVKAPCRVATTANITLSGTQTIDGVAVVAGDRVLVKNQTSSVDNGIWKAGSGAWTRALDFDGTRDAVGGTLVKVNQGSLNANTYWVVDGNGPVTIGTDSISFAASSGNLALQSTLATTAGAGMVGYINSPTGSVARTVQGRLREKVSLLDFGVLNDGLQASSTANSAALNVFATWARAESAAGRRVHVVAPPGVYYWDFSLAPNFVRGVSNLTFSGYGAKFINVYTTGTAFAWPQSCDTLFYANSSNPLIATALKNTTTVTASTPSELSQFSVGEKVMIGGLNIQYNGYPPNLYCFDFVTIVSRDTSTGVMTFTPALEYDYLSTWPEYSGAGGNPYGAARIYKLDRNGYTWDVDHLFEGFDARNLNDAGTNYVSATGRKITFRDCVVPGFAESICEDFLAERCVERLHTEPDKLVKKTVRRDCDIQTTFSLQSASVDTVVVDSCKMPLFTIGGKNLTVRDCDIDQVGFGGNYGFDNDTIFENCRIRTTSGFYPYVAGPRLNSVDANNVTYANGVFTILKNAASGSANGGGLANWNVIPGQMIQFCRGTAGDLTTIAGGNMASDLGSGIILKVEEALSGTAIAVTTTLASAAVPAWSSGQVFKKLRNAPVFRGCTGDNSIRLASEADKAGKLFGEYFHYIFGGKDITTNSIVLAGRVGKLVRFYANVFKPLTGTAGGKVTFTESECYTASTMGSKVTYSIDLDLTVAGVRDFTLSALTGKTGNDAVTHNSVAQTTLVNDAWCELGMQGMAYNYAPSSKNLADLPIYELIFEFDVGLFGKRLTLRKTDAGQTVVGTTGDIA